MAEQEKQQFTKHGKLPIDAKLLAEAVTDLNIARRNSGIYPAEHPIVRESTKRAYAKLRKVFEIRKEITLGVADEALLVDEYTLDRKNPIFSEFAQNLHIRAIASLTFTSELTPAELTSLNELLTMKELPPDSKLPDLAAERDISHVTIAMIDFSKFTFFEDAKRGDDQGKIWEDYIYGFLEGKLGGEGDRGIFLASPEEIAEAVNKVMPDGATVQSCDRIVHAYLGKDQLNFSSAVLNRFFKFVHALRPELKQKFLSRLSAYLGENLSSLERVLSDMSLEEFGKVVELLTLHAPQIPETLRSLMNKLSVIKKDERRTFDFFYQKSAVLDDIEIGEDMLKLFGDDHFRAYVSDEYRQELGRILAAIGGDKARINSLREECREEIIDRTHLDILLELLEVDFVTYEDYLTMVTKLTDMVTAFLETGRFEEVLESYNALKSHSLAKRFNDTATSALDYYFHAPETIARVIESVRIWGRKDRDATIRLVRALRQQIMDPLLAQLSEENDAIMRKFYLSVLAMLGTDLHSHILGRLDDSRWYVVRNMLYLVRESNCTAAIDRVRKLVKHDNPQLCIEAIRTLLYFKTHDALTYLKAFLSHPHPDIRTQAIRMAGASQVREAVPILIEMLGTRDLLGSKTLAKTDVVHALANIGDPDAIPALVKLCKSRVFMNRNHLENLKVAVFKSLDGYPADKVQPLLEIGLAAKKGSIREASRQYQSRMGGEAGSR